jgi:hypothetical protein
MTDEQIAADDEVEYVLVPVSLVHKLLAAIDGGRTGSDEERELRALLERPALEPDE